MIGIPQKVSILAAFLVASDLVTTTMAGKDFGNVERLLMDYMSVDSTTENEGAFGELVKAGLEHNGWIVEKQELDGNPSRFNLLATRRPLEEFSPRVVFNTHLDTVPPFIPPTEDAEKIYGRGSCDAKGMVHTYIHLLRHPKG
ncbi:hypothetical protein Y032_0211g2181 [Ancylostoma ceylanicum]|uniref:Peptidase M20 dimerisation domain-containing protein n=1 Tax=Ancylostoma ceylanicum TaxID=53326 RepID=A0A016SKY4_9BILA|nr:hypothetical protein Y032_0211g2181 [Ancylostoma ceylanicum]